MRIAWRRAVPLLTVGSLLLAAQGGSPALASTPPSAAVTSPSAGAVVAGFVTVTATGQVDASVNDTTSALQLYVDGSYAAQKSCPGSSRSCTQSFSWDTTSLYGSHSLTVKVKTAGSGWGTSPAVAVQVGVPPAVSVDSPAAGSTVAGQVAVTLSGSVDQLQPDTVKTLTLLVDGAVVGSVSCTGAGGGNGNAHTNNNNDNNNDNGDSSTCSGSISWDSSGLTGQRSLQAKLATAKGQTATSSPVDVTVTSPPPTASVTSPGQVVKGTVKVALSGAVDAGQSDTAKQLSLLVDGASVGTTPCPGGRTCSGSVSWNPHGATGAHQLTAQLTTAAGRTGTGAAVAVWVFGETKVSLSAPATTVAGHPVTVTGRVVLTTGAPAAGARVRVVAVSSLGRSSRDSTVTADANGVFAATYPAQSRTTVTATVLAGASWSSSSATTRGAVTPAPTCTVKAGVKHGAADPVSCRLGDVTRGTALSLQVLQGSSWRTVASARSTGGTWTTSRVFAAKGTYWVRVSVAASNAFTAGTSAPVKVFVS